MNFEGISQLTWLVNNILGHNLRTRFFPSMLFKQNFNYHYCASFKLKKKLHQWTNFFVKSKKHHFWGIFGHYPQNEFFLKKSSFVTFLPLMQFNFMQSFRKILWAVSDQLWLLTDIHTDRQTDRQWWNHRTPIHLKAGVQ